MLSKTALTRINKELRMLKVSPLGQEKIYVIPDEEDITLARALMFLTDYQVFTEKVTAEDCTDLCNLSYPFGKR